jgi:hypothetical protein
LHGIRVTCNRSGLFQKRLSEVRNGRGKQLCVLLLGSAKNKIDKAFGHSRCQLSNIDPLLPLDMLLNPVLSGGAAPTAELAAHVEYRSVRSHR